MIQPISFTQDDMDRCLDTLNIVRKQRDRLVSVIAEIILDCKNSPTKFGQYHLDKLAIVLYNYMRTEMYGEKYGENNP